MRYILFALTFFSISFSSCINKPKDRPATTTNAPLTPLDTIQSAPAVSAKPALLETAFIKGTQGKIKNLTFNLYGITLGNIKIPSGYIVACDPFLVTEYGQPYTQLFPTGEFPAQLSIANLPGKGETIAFARIKFSDEPVAKWEYALLKGEKPAPVGSNDELGYVVDAGLGIFVDKKTLDSLDRKEVANMGHDVYKQVNKKYRNGWSADIYTLGQDNLAAFTSGFGDGRYSTYIGFDANGKVCRLVTDFDLFNWKQK